MEIEVIRFGKKTAKGKPPLLFIHGSYCGAWIWERHFLPAFAKAGYRGAAISLRGHGASEGIDQISAFGIADYLADVQAGVQLFDQTPVLIGHSLGGYVVQKYALENNVAGLVLMCSPSLLGLSGSAQHILSNRPELAMELSKLCSTGSLQLNASVIRDALFSDPEVARKMEATMPMLQKESMRFSFEASWPEWRRPQSKVPTLVLGAENDAFIPSSDLRHEAMLWDGELKIIPEAPHGLMIDPCWPEAFDEVKSWLKKTYA